MKFFIISLFPEMFRAISDYGIIARAVKNQKITLHFKNPRDFTEDNYRTIDDRPYGGGPGMVMKVEPLRRAIHAARNEAPANTRCVYLSPQGQQFKQTNVKKFASEEAIILLCGRYEGIDQRIIENDVDECWSIGDYVVSGGELPAMIIIDSISRLLPGVLGDDESSVRESFSESLLDCPHYTRPEIIDGQKVPLVLLSGNHADIERWRKKQQLGQTWLLRPDLLNEIDLNEKECILLEEFKKEQLT